MQSKITKLIKLNPTQYPSVFQVQLNLEMQTRYIGKLDLAGGGTFLCKRKPSHIFNKYGGSEGSLGINHSLLTDESIPFHWILIDFNKHKFVTSRLYLLSHGRCFKFGNRGFELQCFLPLDEFGLTRAREWESKLVIQGNLFVGEAA